MQIVPLPHDQALFKAEGSSWVYLVLFYAYYTWMSQPYCVLQFKQHLSVIALWCLFLGHAGFFVHRELGFHNHFFQLKSANKICLLCYWSSLLLSLLAWHCLFFCSSYLEMKGPWNFLTCLRAYTPLFYVTRGMLFWEYWYPILFFFFNFFSGCLKDASRLR